MKQSSWFSPSGNEIYLISKNYLDPSSTMISMASDTAKLKLAKWGMHSLRTFVASWTFILSMTRFEIESFDWYLGEGLLSFWLKKFLNLSVKLLITFFPLGLELKSELFVNFAFSKLSKNYYHSNFLFGLQFFCLS